MFTRRGEENRPFLNLGKRRERRGVFQNDWGSNPDWNFMEGKQERGGTHSWVIPCCLWPSPCLHAVARKQIPIKSGLQGNETALLWGKSYTNPFLFNLMANPGGSVTLGWGRWVLKISADVCGGNEVWFLRRGLPSWKCPGRSFTPAGLPCLEKAWREMKQPKKRERKRCFPRES